MSLARNQAWKITAAAMLLLAGCASPAIYAPRLPGQQTGYTDQRLTDNRYRVTFTGNSSTPREQVEDDLLRRSAEVTLAAGYGHFLFDTRNTLAKTKRERFLEPGTGFGWGDESWNYYPREGYGPFLPAWDITTTTRYGAYAEIVLLTDDQAAHEPRAIDAKQIIARLAAPPASQRPPV